MNAVPRKRAKPDPAKKRLGTGELVPDWMDKEPWWPPTSSPLQSIPRQTTKLVVDSQWMTTHGVIVVDRGYPVVPWVCAITVGNHTMYKNDTKYGGYPYLLARGWLAMGWREGTALANATVKIPGTPNMWWVPRWCLTEYLQAVGRIWNGFALSIRDVCIGRPQRYTALKEAHRRYHVGPWVRKQLGRNYPHQVVLAGMGYPAERKDHVKSLIDQAMKNYPTPHEMMAGVWASRPWIMQAVPEVPEASPGSEWWGPTTRNTRKSRLVDNGAAVFSMWDATRVNAMAMDAADKHWHVLSMTAFKILQWLTVNPKTGRYNTFRPTHALKAYISRVNRLRSWMGPGADHSAFDEMVTTASEILNAGAALNKTAPDNPWRLYYHHRLKQIDAAVTTKAYRAAVKAWWRTGDPRQAPRTAPLLVYVRPFF